MSEPADLAAYERRFYANQQITGFGLDTIMHMPCPFCAAAGFASWRILEAEEAMQQERICRRCGRSGRVMFSVNTPDRKQFEFVQTGGPDPPPWLQPAPRRIKGSL